MLTAPAALAPQVKLGLEEVATDLFRVKPYVYSAPNNAAVIVFSGEAMQRAHAGDGDVLLVAWAAPRLAA